nr:UDP-glucuronosyltransferase 2C1-like isoform X2 [Leptinotarsa decemlineata]
MLTEHILSHKKVQDLLLSNETFDLVIVEQFGNEAHMGFASHFSAPLVTFSSIGLSEWNSHLVGNIKLPSIVPFSLSSHSNHMNFIQRVTNTMAHIFDAIYKELIYFPWQQSMLDKYFPQKMDLKTIMFNTSFMLLNSHSISTEPVQLTSSVAEIGGFHITPNELPKSVQEFLDGAENGVILFSLGSNLRSSDLPRGTLDMILEVFRRIPQRIIWKFEETDIHHKHDNVMISKWMQQSDILAHPNTRAFITHGGILSTTEAIHYGVPMIGIPILGDQYMNVARMVRKRLCINLPLPELTENSFHEAIREVIENPEYRNNAQKYSKIFRDRLNKPLDEAVFWIEYVLRHSGATHLRNASMDLYWFQLYTLDVWLFIFSWPILFYLFGRA